jgi:glycosyltransferase involved in cell wall biosynthesis
MTGRPKVSVCVITYNHEKYLRECLDSIVQQETSFPFEVIVGDDVSKDGTRAILAEFAERYPGLVFPIYQDRNIGGGSHNFRTVHLAARGEYVAHVDGDDTILPGKLQAQVDVLDANPDVSFAVHAVRVIGTQQVLGADARYPVRGTLHDLLRFGTYFVHSSVMYRRLERGIADLPEDCVDYYMHVERAARGTIYLDKRVFGGYRVHDAGLTRLPAFADRIEQAYERAFDRAVELGQDFERVQRARLDRRMKFAIARCLAGDVAGYRIGIALAGGDWPLASLRHRLLHLSRRSPGVVHSYFALKRLLGRREESKRFS